MVQYSPYASRRQVSLAKISPSHRRIAGAILCCRQIESDMSPPITSRTALLLDIDGTILDFASTPEGVVVPDELREALAAVKTHLGGALAFVSGRSLASIDRLFGDLRAAAIGAHGGEIRFSDGRILRSPALPDFVKNLFFSLNGRFPGLLIEDKDCAVALHYRHNPEALPAIELSLHEHATELRAAKIAILRGSRVLEARYADTDKGTAVLRLMKTPPFSGRDVIFGGDDTTDMDVFRILPALDGYGFSVGRRYEGTNHLFDGPAQVRAWLYSVAKDLPRRAVLRKGAD